MTCWGDHDRIEKIRRIVKDIHRDLTSIDAILRHIGTKVPDVTRSRPVDPLDEAVGMNPGVSGEGDE